jgi:hypothetical protein
MNKGDFCPECFALQDSHCHECCKEILRGQEYLLINNQQFHRACYTRDIPCAYCKGPILGALKHVLDNHYHPKCFICTGCSKVLDENVMWHERNGWPYCDYCFKTIPFDIDKSKLRNAPLTEAERKAEEQRQVQLQRMREQESRWRQIAPPVLGEITVPGTGSGFVVDPITGEKKPSSWQPKK